MARDRAKANARRRADRDYVRDQQERSGRARYSPAGGDKWGNGSVNLKASQAADKANVSPSWFRRLAKRWDLGMRNWYGTKMYGNDDVKAVKNRKTFGKRRQLTPG